MKNNEIGNKLIHENLNINKKGFYPKNYINNKYHFINNNNTEPNINPMMNNKLNYFNYQNNINTIANKTFSGHFYYNNYNNPNLVNNGWLYSGDDNTYYFEQSDENNPSNFYYVINKFQDNLPSRYIRP